MEVAVSDFPGSPRLLKGALAVFETSLPVPTNLIVFQYNPESLSRSLDQRAAYENPWVTAGDSDTPVLPPTETFNMSVELDATDQLAVANPIALTLGLHPAIAQIEQLLYPPSTALILQRALAQSGIAILGPAKLPLVLLIWGRTRVVPVRVTSVSVTEQAFDQALNPIQAKVDLGMRALNLDELDRAGAPFSTLGIVRMVAQEAISRAAGVSAAVQQIRGLLPF
jgi:hypothetical protein